jgi:hypothetical protein
MGSIGFLVVALVVLALGACSENPSGEAPRKGGLSSGMSEDVWKAYGGAESGVTDTGKDARGGKQ